MSSLLMLISRRAEPSRRVRRATVVVALAAIPAVVLIPARFPRDWPILIWLIALVLLLAVLFLPLFMLTEFRRNICRRSLPDERERQRRDEAYRLSYRIVEAGWVLMPLVVLLFGGPLMTIAANDLILLWMTGWGWVIFLPYAVFAWREPDAPA